MKRILLLTLLLVAASQAYAKTLRWRDFAVTAHLDSAGRLHVSERHTILFDGDWNGGERTFHRRLTDDLRLESLSRIDDSGNPVPLHRDNKLATIDSYAWHGSNTLRWRSRLPSDPPFHGRAITYVLDYTDGYILEPQGDAYRLDHNFGMPDLEYPIDRSSVDLTLDSAWQTNAPVALHLEQSNLGHGANATITDNLRYLPRGRPASVRFPVSMPVRYAVAGALVAAMALFTLLFVLRERRIGRFRRLPAPDSIDRAWLDEHVFKFLPEVVGAAWDERTGAAEVCAVLARMVHEGKMTSRVEKGGPFKRDELILTLQRDKSSFTGYEKSLVDALFFSGDTTSTSAIREHYRSTGFDPVKKIRDPLEKKETALGRDKAPAIPRLPTLVLFAGGLGLTVAAGFEQSLNIIAAAFGMAAVLVLYLLGVAGAFDYRRRLTRLGAASVEFALPAVLLAAVAAAALFLPVTTLFIAGLLLAALGAIRSLFNLASTREAGERLENRRRLAAARAWFIRELAKPQPALEDAWFPYILAFGLGRDVDRWFRSFGGLTSPVMHGTNFDTSSGSSSGGGWTGGGGAFGGAGASGSWAVAAGAMSAGVSAPSSSSGGGGGGGGSSGGGGGGGW